MAEQRWPQAADHTHASFPAMDKIPESARAAVDDFLNMRVRIADATDAVRQAHLDLANAMQKENQALKQHIHDGGTTSSFERIATKAGNEAIDNANQDYKVLKELIGPTYLAAMEALKAAAAEGIATAEADLEATTPVYLNSIDTVEQARRDYLAAIGLRYFWSYLLEGHQAMAIAGARDQFVLRNGPVTRVDDHTFSAMRSDAKAHTRISGTNAASSTW